MRTATATIASLMIVVSFVTASHTRALAEPPGAVSGKPPSPSAEEQIRTIEQQEANALLRADAAALERFWAPGLLVTASNNKIRTRDEVLGYVKSGQLKLTKLERHIEEVAVHGQVAIAMGRETIVPAGGDNAGKTLSRRYTDVYQQDGGSWRLIARQQTLVPATP